MFDRLPENQQYYDQSRVPVSMREVDFYLINDDKFYRCEVKLMGKGNPESADAIFARESSIFVADKLSDLNFKGLEVEGYKFPPTIKITPNLFEASLTSMEGNNVIFINQQGKIYKK